jgi:hypothetical protein
MPDAEGGHVQSHELDVCGHGAYCESEDHDQEIFVWPIDLQQAQHPRKVQG